MDVLDPGTMVSDPTLLEDILLFVNSVGVPSDLRRRVELALTEAAAPRIEHSYVADQAIGVSEHNCRVEMGGVEYRIPHGLYSRDEIAAWYACFHAQADQRYRTPGVSLTARLDQMPDPKP